MTTPNPHNRPYLVIQKNFELVCTGRHVLLKDGPFGDSEEWISNPNTTFVYRVWFDCQKQRTDELGCSLTREETIELIKKYYKKIGEDHTVEDTDEIIFICH